MFSGTIFAQGITIRGKVVDDKNEPLIGATVKVKASPTTATTTNVAGDFTLRVPENTTIVTVSYIGYVSSDITLKPGTTTLGNIILANDANSLNEVVVVGYGAQNKRDVTGSIAQVSASTLQESPSSNFVDELKGRTAGVDIVSNSSGPGASGSIRIRGNRSMATSSSAADQLDQPLYVVDGIPFTGQLNDINQDDIASLEILKDASATAIYGSRGSGGVILITTKRGKVGKGVVSYNAYYGVSSILGEIPVFNGPEYAAFKAEAAAGSDNGTTAYPLTAQDQAGLAAGTNTDWQKLIYQKGYTTDQNIDVSGGDEATQYSLGGGYFVQTGNTKNLRFERYSLRTTIDHKIGKNIRVGINTLNTLSYNNNPGGTGLVGTALKISPLVSPYLPNGEINIFPFTGSIDAPSYINPLFATTNPGAVYNNTRRLSTFNTLYGEVSFAKYFKYRINVGLTFNQQQQEQYNGIFSSAAITNSSLTTASVANSEYYKYTLENLLTFDRTFGKSKVGFTGLFSAEKTHSDNNYFQGTGIPFDYIQASNLGQAITINSAANQNAYAETGLVSYMARVNYSYDSRYLLTATVRVDGSSVLAPGHNYYTYPALALGWNITNEQWMKDVQAIDNLKFRIGYGKTANQGVAAYTTLGGLGASPYEYGNNTAGNQPGYRVTNLANSSLGWESTGEFNAGFDFGLFKDRLTGTIDVYTQKTTGILVAASLPPSNGANSQTNNFGASSSKGLEITLSSINIRNQGGFSWSTDFNIAFSRERIDALYSGVSADINNGWFVGQPLTVIYDVKKLGIWQTGDPGLAKQTSPVERVGMIKAQDINGDGKVDASDRQ
ncbi:MAG TPA: SusC/RagA family TonB-linked outer membrane protein, partial [Mucilaginibacter sp.]